MGKEVMHFYLDLYQRDGGGGQQQQGERPRI